MVVGELDEVWVVLMVHMDWRDLRDLMGLGAD